jgi:hypothetical protein
MRYAIRLMFANTGIVPAARSCLVLFTDSEGIRHAVEITASTRYEAAVLALGEFRRRGFADATFGPATNLTVRVRQPEMSHTVSVGQLKSWRQKSKRARDEESST